MAFFECVANNGTSGMVLVSVSGRGTIGTANIRAILYSDSDNNVYRNYFTNNTNITMNSSDFDGTINGNAASTIRVKRAGKYLINNTGVESVQTLSANDSVTIPIQSAAGQQYWFMLKIS